MLVLYLSFKFQERVEAEPLHMPKTGDRALSQQFEIAKPSRSNSNL